MRRRRTGRALGARVRYGCGGWVHGDGRGMRKKGVVRSLLRRRAGAWNSRTPPRHGVAISTFHPLLQLLVDARELKTTDTGKKDNSRRAGGKEREGREKMPRGTVAAAVAKGTEQGRR